MCTCGDGAGSLGIITDVDMQVSHDEPWRVGEVPICAKAKCVYRAYPDGVKAVRVSPFLANFYKYSSTFATFGGL